jgi:hypothetical protein
MTNTTITPATKSQLDALIEIVKDAGMNEAAGLLQLGSDEITKELKKRESCICLIYIGDNGDCPVHGKGLEQNHGAFSDAEIRADYQERNDLYVMGMGA